jgi:Rod binding domain-containing protein
MSPLATPASLPQPAVGAPRLPTDPGKLWQAARDFEAMAISQFLQPMFDTVDLSKGLFGGGSAEAAWKPMLVQEFGKMIGAHGGLGLAQPVYAAMLRAQEAQSQ